MTPVVGLKPWALRGILCVFLVSMGLSAFGQIQQAWVARYNNGIATGTNQAVKMALDSIGNIYVTGFSQNARTNLGYVTIKYAPNGTQLWATRYDSTNFPNAQPVAMAMDANNGVVLTGTALTIKYDSKGNQLWTAPYAGSSVAADSNLNSYVVGIDRNFGTIKLNPMGEGLWYGSYPSTAGPSVSQVVAVDGNGNVDVGGSRVWLCDKSGCHGEFDLVQFGTTGNLKWHLNAIAGVDYYGIQLAGMALDHDGNIYMCGYSYNVHYFAVKCGQNGTLVWQSGSFFNFLSVGGFNEDSIGRVTLAGDAVPTANNYPNTSYVTVKLETNGISLWTNYCPRNPTNANAATGSAVDQSDNSYVTGYSPGTNSSNNIVTIKYDPNGNQIWLQRYTGLNNGGAVGNAIAVDSNGNVYVTGYENTPQGGTEMVLIKYSPLVIQRRSDGTFQLQAQGSPGQSFDVQASTNLQTWQDLGSVIADTNGLMQYDDLDSTNFDWRFYLTVPK